MMHPHNITGIVIGAVAAWVFGAIYYTALGRPWLAAQGKTIEQCKAEQADKPKLTFYLPSCCRSSARSSSVSCSTAS